MEGALCMQQAKLKGSLRRIPSREDSSSTKSGLGIFGLVMIGIGGIIGAGFFLGCGVPIQAAGPAVLISFLVGGLMTAQVTGALTSVAVKHPVIGSFKVYADDYIGPFVGYLQGWIYYLTGVLTIASEAVAMGVFTKVWFPEIPLWVSSLTYSAIIVVINAFGVRSFDRVESFMTVVKISALVAFILFAAFVLLHGPVVSSTSSATASGSFGGKFFAHGVSGILRSMLIVIFAYAGIGVFATAAVDVKNGQKVERSAVWTVVLLTVLYVLSIFLLLSIESWTKMSTATSPFVLALMHNEGSWLAEGINGAILMASFSVMAGSVFSSTQILVSLGQSGEAPRLVNHVSKRGISYGGLAITAAGIGVAIGAAYALPSSVYNFLISASSFMTFFYWAVMLWTFLRWRKTQEGRTARISRLAFGAPYSTYLTLGLFVLLTIYALFEPSQRIAFYAFLVLVALLVIGYWFVRASRKSA
jgi:L-asparagine transporter-like permease